MPFGPHFDRRMKLASWVITAPIVYYMTFVEEYSHIEGEHCLVPVSEGGWKRYQLVFVAPLCLIPRPLRLYKFSNDLQTHSPTHSINTGTSMAPEDLG